MRPLTPAFAAAYLPLIAGLAATLLLLIWVGPVLAADSVPSGAQKALAPVTKMIATLVAIAIGLGIAICSAGPEPETRLATLYTRGRRLDRTPGSRAAPPAVAPRG
jgi:hypothetical protein